ncbi:MAG: hypothetical protein ACQERN_04330 [Thermodesulfobacteriota bacterium]
MENKFFKIGAVLLVLLFVGLVAAVISLTTGEQSDPAKQSAVQEKPAPGEAENTAGSRAFDRSRPKDRPSGDGKTASESTETRQAPEPKPMDKPPERGLSPEEKAENREEIARMKEKLPGNMYVPKDPRDGFDQAGGEKLKNAIQLENKINKGTASREEKIEYYNFKIESISDRIEIMNYIADRTAELSEKSDKTYLSETDRSVGKNRIEEMKKRLSQYEEKLSELKPASDK